MFSKLLPTISKFAKRTPLRVLFHECFELFRKVHFQENLEWQFLYTKLGRNNRNDSNVTCLSVDCNNSFRLDIFLLRSLIIKVCQQYKYRCQYFCWGAKYKQIQSEIKHNSEVNVMITKTYFLTKKIKKEMNDPTLFDNSSQSKNW